MGDTQAQSPPTLRRVMRAIDYFTLAFGSIVGVGWMVVIEEWLRRGGPGGAMLAFLLGGLALVPVALVYGRLAQRMPGAASEIAYTAAVFPPVVSFLTGWSMTFAYLVVCPFEAVAIGQIAAYVFPQMMTAVPLYDVGKHTIYLPQLLLGIGTTVCITVLNYRGIRLGTGFQNWTTFGLLAVFCVFAPLGWWHGHFQQMQPFFSQGTDLAGAALSTLAVLPIVPYFLTGFETIPKCSEEAAEHFEPRRFGGIMLLALAVGTFFYVAVVSVVAMLHPWQQLANNKFATAIAFREAFGAEWLVQLMLLGALLSLLKVFNGMFLASTRLVYAMGQRGLLLSSLGSVAPRWRTPTGAIVLVSSITLLSTFLGGAVLEPISDSGSVAGALGWLAACLALCFGAGGQTTGKVLALGISGAVISLLLLVVALLDFQWYHWLALTTWGVLGMVLWVTRTKRSEGLSLLRKGMPE